jgi:hypothetical protein
LSFLGDFRGLSDIERLNILLENKELKAILDLIDMYDESVETEGSEEIIIHQKFPITVLTELNYIEITNKKEQNQNKLSELYSSIFLPPPQIL